MLLLHVVSVFQQESRLNCSLKTTLLQQVEDKVEYVNGLGQHRMDDTTATASSTS